MESVMSWNLAIAGLFLAFPQGPGRAPVEPPTDAPRPPGERPQERPAPSVIRPEPSDAEREIVELFGRVERTLDRIDRLLQEAATANATPAGGASAESGDLAGRLRHAQESGAEVRKAIDRIIELAAQQRPQSSSSSSSGSSQCEDGSPLDSQGEQSTGRESTPSMPERTGEKPEGSQDQKQPKPGGDEPKDQQGGLKDPKGPRDSKTPPHQIPGGEPKAGETGAGSSPADGRDRWGDLPLHAREVFRNEGGRDMPPLYRDWIDAYYRRLNQKP